MKRNQKIDNREHKRKMERFKKGMKNKFMKHILYKLGDEISTLNKIFKRVYASTQVSTYLYPVVCTSRTVFPAAPGIGVERETVKNGSSLPSLCTPTNFPSRHSNSKTDRTPRVLTPDMSVLYVRSVHIIFVCCRYHTTVPLSGVFSLCIVCSLKIGDKSVFGFVCIRQPVSTVRATNSAIAVLFFEIILSLKITELETVVEFEPSPMLRF
jgi:hypothetical protein